MKNNLNFIIYTLILLLTLFSCEKDDYLIKEDNNTNIYFQDNEYNSDFNNFAKAVRHSLIESKEFRKLVKKEALLMFDGDYDIILKNIIEKEISQPSTYTNKTKKKNYTVKDLLLDAYTDCNKNSENNFKNSETIIDYLSEKYPNLQIAIPIHAEDWDETSYIPTVTFLPKEYSDESTKKITGYDSKGKTVAIDVIHEPEVPVIVISENERSMIISDPYVPVPPPVPTNLSGIQTESGIRLNWNMPSSTNSLNTTGYYVYRKSVTDINYTKQKTIPGAYNRSYDDNNVVAGRSYSYFVIAYCQGETSAPSNYINITAPNYPKPVVSFDAIQNSKNEIELRWENDNTQFVLETKLSKHVVGVTPNYQIIKVFSANNQDYFDHDIILGKKVTYKINHVTSLGESNAKYDFVQVPYRDISTKSPVYIKQISFTDWKIERWPAGKPEFYITVTNVDAAGKTPYLVQDQIICDFSDKTNISQTFCGKKVLDWQPGYWYDMLTFTVIEYDKPSGTLTLKASVGYNKKNILKTGLDVAAGVDYEIEFSNKGEKCGNSYLNYFDEPEQWLEFPNYGVKILVSDLDN